MSESRNLTRVPVDMLREGLYVAEPDCPWHEVPVMFQGFVLRTAQDIKVFQKHCSYVYVAPERSIKDAYAALASELAGLSGFGESAQAGDVGVAMAAERHPAKRGYAERAQAAAVDHREAVEYVERALADVRLGRALRWQEARPLVQSLTEQLANNSAAVLWLTKLKHKDMQSSAHAVNVCVFSMLFGMYLGLPEEQLQNIGLGALLHDIGKAKLPPEILGKAGVLDRDEWAVVKRHPEEGVELVFDDRELPREVREIIMMHHERIDGQGYPWGLGAKNLPDHVRIVSLANTYDSHTSERADQVLQEMYNSREQTVGAELVQAFIHCLGIFPIGTLVELNNGALGVVIDSDADSRLKPTVLLVRTPDGQPYTKRLLLNLAAVPDARPGQTTQFIRRAVNPANYDVDVAAIIAFEFGIDWYGSGSAGEPDGSDGKRRRLG